ncbi:hypothetical protein JW964_19990 [candidate division KSB1 bacterium]|nr:hypothetical protein [candidate division KSB1 bacterium]
MAKATGKGSIILKLIIVILIGVLAAAIMIPKQMWDEEEKNTTTCRQRMSSLLSAELLFQKYNEKYCPDLDTLLAFFQKDVEKKYELEFVRLDTFLNVQLMKLVGKDSIVKSIIDSVNWDTTYRDIKKAIEIDYFMAEAMVNVALKHDAQMARIIKPVLDVNYGDKMAPSKAMQELANHFSNYDIMKVLNMDDSLATVMRQIAPDMDMSDYLPKIKNFNHLSTRIDSFYAAYLDSLGNCPTVMKPYRIAVGQNYKVNDAVIEELEFRKVPVEIIEKVKTLKDKEFIGDLAFEEVINTLLTPEELVAAGEMIRSKAGSTVQFSNIYCPLDSTDILRVENDWWKKKIGGLKLENHGEIYKNERNWEKQ